MLLSADRICLGACAALLSISLFTPGTEQGVPENPQIDFDAFLQDAKTVDELRRTRRVSEEEFLKMAAEPGTIVLDTRSAAKFQMLHLAGATHLNLSDFTKDSLATVIPGPDTRILIYCNNNFITPSQAMLLKAPPAALNIPTFIGLYTYGYRNVWELGPVVDVAATELRFEGSSVMR